MSGCIKRLAKTVGFALAFLSVSACGFVFFIGSDFYSSNTGDGRSTLSASQAESRVINHIESNEEGVRVVNLERGVFTISFYARGDDENAMVDLICYLQNIESRIRGASVYQIASFDERTIGETVGSLPVAEWVLIADPTPQEIRNYDCSRGAPDLEDQVNFVDER